MAILRDFSEKKAAGRKWERYIEFPMRISSPMAFLICPTFSKVIGVNEYVSLFQRRRARSPALANGPAGRARRGTEHHFDPTHFFQNHLVHEMPMH
jgi:hypothetical protein